VLSIQKKQGTIQVLVLGFLHAMMHVYASCLSPIYILLQQEFNVSNLQLGFFESMRSITRVLQGPAGYLASRIGRKKIIVIGMFVNAVAIFFFGLSPTFFIFLLLVGIAGIGGAPFHPASYSIVSERAPREHMTKSIAYHQGMGFIGAAVGTAAVAYLAEYLGWRTALQILTIPGLIVLVLFWNFIKENETKSSKDQGTKKETKTDEGEFKITTPLLIVYLVNLVGSFGGGLQRFLPMFLSLEYGESIVWDGALSGIMQIVGVVSLTIGGTFADRTDKIWLIFIFRVLTGISTIALALGNFGSRILLLVLCFMGFARYFSTPARRAITAIISKTSPKGIGLEFASAALGGILAAPLTGYLIDVYGMRTAFLILSPFTFLSGALILLLKKWPNAYSIQN
jgi:MFS family permease